jgi:hypothetical protein
LLHRWVIGVRGHFSEGEHHVPVPSDHSRGRSSRDLETENEIVIWIILVVAGGSVGVVSVHFFVPRKKRKPVTWPEIAEKGILDTASNANELLRLFFLPDSINPPDFLTNFLEFSKPPEGGPPPGGADKPTPSAATFEKGGNAPLGYPGWFLAAYPDVVVWLASRDENAMLRITAEAMYGTDGAKELVRIHGLQRIGELMEEKFEAFDLPQLRRLIVIYRSNTKKRLECALIVKEQRPRWWLLETTTSKRVSIAT